MESAEVNACPIAFEGSKKRVWNKRIILIVNTKGYFWSIKLLNAHMAKAEVKWLLPDRIIRSISNWSLFFLAQDFDFDKSATSRLLKCVEDEFCRFWDKITRLIDRDDDLVVAFFHLIVLNYFAFLLLECLLSTVYFVEFLFKFTFSTRLLSHLIYLNQSLSPWLPSG